MHKSNRRSRSVCVLHTLLTLEIFFTRLWGYLLRALSTLTRREKPRLLIEYALQVYSGNRTKQLFPVYNVVARSTQQIDTAKILPDGRRTLCDVGKSGDRRDISFLQ